MAERRPDAPAVTQVTPLCAGRPQLTYRELHHSIAGMAECVRKLGGPGDVMMLCSQNRPEFIPAFLSVLAAGRTVFPIHPGLADSELVEAASKTGAIGVIGSQSPWALRVNHHIETLNILECWKPEPRSNRNDISSEGAEMLLQSSGTTGAPKIVRRSAESLDAVARNVAHATGMTSVDRVLAAIPLCHSYGIEHALLAPLLAGAAVNICNGFDPDTALRQLRSDGVTLFPGTPFMFQSLAERADGFEPWPSMRLAYSAGGPLPRRIYDACVERFGVRIGQIYGSTEVGSVTWNDPNAPNFDPECVGYAMKDVDIRIVDPDQPALDAPFPPCVEGQIVISAPSMLDGYLETSALDEMNSGYFLTGDLGILDERNCLRVTGRTKLQIDVGAAKVNPLEVERALIQHPDVIECVILPLAVSETLNRLRAMITVRNGSHAPAASELRTFLRERLASHKIPRVFEYCDCLPKSPTGKILREELMCQHG